MLFGYKFINKTVFLENTIVFLVVNYYYRINDLNF